MKHKLQKAAALTAVFLCLSVCTVPAYAQSSETPPTATAAPTASPEPTATPVPSPESEETPDTTATPKPFTPGGTGTLVDEAADTDGKEFYTIRTPDENVFYLVIDKQRGSENVYFLNAVTEQDLQSLAQKDKKAEVVKPTPTPETAPTPTPEPVEKKSESNMGVLLLVLAVVVIGGGAGYYFKIYRPKHQVPELEESEYEDENEEVEAKQPIDEDEPEEELEETE